MGCVFFASAYGRERIGELGGRERDSLIGVTLLGEGAFLFHLGGMVARGAWLALPASGFRMW